MNENEDLTPFGMVLNKIDEAFKNSNEPIIKLDSKLLGNEIIKQEIQQINSVEEKVKEASKVQEPIQGQQEPILDQQEEDIDLSALQVVEIIGKAKLKPYTIYLNILDGEEQKTIGVNGFISEFEKKFFLLNGEPLNMPGFEEKFQNFLIK